MTTFMISQFINRAIPQYTLDDECVFCKIIQRVVPAHIVYEDQHVIAFLDILPIRPGHTLLVPKAHHARLTDLPPELASALGTGLTKIGDAVTKGMDNPNVNFVCNQGYAQAVHHVHFHLVPAPVFNTDSIFSKGTPATTVGESGSHSTGASTSDALPLSTSEASPISEAASTKNIPRATTPPNTETICRLERENREELEDDDAVRIAERIRSKL